jgi:iron complex transport system ATP-binding protein
METLLLEAKAVSAGYDGRVVLTDFSLSAQAGEFIGLVGPNGSGKSTLIRVFSRILRPFSGTVMAEGEDIWKKRAPWLAKRVAVVPQDSSPAFDFTILEMALMGRSPHLGRFSIEGKADIAVAWECLKLTQMEEFADRLVTAVSGGERQRAVIARALAQQPKILLADEPIAHLDINHQIQILDLLQHLTKQKGVAVIAALHDLNLAASYCDRLVMLGQGKIVASGAPAEVITEAHVRHTYGLRAQVKSNPATGRPYITLSSRRAPAKSPATKELKIHVICGAGTGAELMEELIAEGYEVSAGVVNVMDSDQQAAESLDIVRVEEAPFSPISEESHRQNCALAAEADIVVVCAIPFGPGNIANLKAAEAALRAGRKVLLVNSPAIENRDFANGEAIALNNKMLSQGAVGVEDMGAIPASIARCGAGVPPPAEMS